MTHTPRSCDRCLTKRASDPSFPDCDAHVSTPCRNCRGAVSFITGKQPCCQLRGQAQGTTPGAFGAIQPILQTMPFAPIDTHPDKVYERMMSERYAAHRQSPPPSLGGPAERPRSSYYRPSEGESSGRLSSPPSWQTRPDERRGNSDRQINVDSYRPTHTPPTLSPVAGSSLADAPYDLSCRSREAERERASSRTDFWRLREQQITTDHLQGRLELEIRARAAADERAETSYDLGLKHGMQMQIMEAQALARAPALPHSFMPYPTPQPMRSLRPPFQDHQTGYGHINSQTPSTSHNMPQSLGDASDAFRQRPSVSTSSHSMSPQASSQYGGPAMLSGSTEHAQPSLTSRDETAPHGSAGKTPDAAATTSSAEVAPGARVDSADVRLSELRKKAMATTAAFRDRQAAQQWLDQNSHLVEGRTSAASAESTAGGKRKRTQASGEEQYESLLRRSPEMR